MPPDERVLADVIQMGGPEAVRLRHLASMRRAGLRDSTIQQRRRSLARLARHLGTDDLLVATDEQLEKFLDRLSGTDGLAAEVYHLKGFYGWAHEYGLIGSDPAHRLRRPRIARRLPRPIPGDDLALALQQATGRVRPILYLAAYAGLRATDMCGLRASDLMWNDRLVMVAEGKGGHERMVDMADTLLWALRTSDLPTNGWLFPFMDGKVGHLPAHRISQLANRFLHSLGIASTLHQLRHWAGTEFYRATHDIRATQQFLGHQSITSSAIYTMVDRDATSAGVALLPVIGRAG